MSATHTEHPKKKHGNDVEQAMESADAHTIEGAAVDSVPAPDSGAHAHSHAAHLGDDAHGSTLPAGNLRQGYDPTSRAGELRQPSQEVDRLGKQHRK